MKNKPSITFVLSGPAPIAVGGLRIIYEYANRLSRKGWKVSVVHPVRLEKSDKNVSFFIRLKRRLGLLKNRVLRTYLPKKWFLTDSKVKMLLIPNLNEKHIPDAEYIVACPMQTVQFVYSYSPQKGKKHYFIQGFEDWVMPAQDVENTWKMPLKKIVVSNWLQKRIERINETAITIPNGLDFSSFHITIAFNQRKPNSLLFLSHFQELKGTIFAVDAVKRLMEKYPQLDVQSFSAYDKPSYFPDFIRFHQDPPQDKIRQLYNSCRFFISPSLSEGWPLPPAEAMMCGCAVIATDIPGHREYIIDGKNGFLCAPGSSSAIVEKLDFLFNNPANAETIACHARESLKPFDWDSRVALFEKALLT